ncbi:hypothetical protein ABEB36_013803 [Hypothenemus hampei]|uniref:Uncharacterized protein n=1 Tax=Hypothenemus hampei TaxID=57062 RepID=A0ABD1E5P3_HYPHA
MIDTADSNTSSKIWAMINRFNVKELSNLPDCPIRVSSRWLAIMFAVSRSVPERIQFLIVSTITKNGSSGQGASCGTRCANMLIVLFVHPKTINPNHIGSLSLSDLLGLAVYGREKMRVVLLRERLYLAVKEFFRLQFLKRAWLYFWGLNPVHYSAILEFCDSW